MSSREDSVPAAPRRLRVRLAAALKAAMLLAGCSLAGIATWHLATWLTGAATGGDYWHDPDLGLQLATHGNPLDLFGSAIRPAMMPLSLLVRLPVIVVSHALGLVKLDVVHLHQTHLPAISRADLSRFEVGSIAVFAFGAAAIVMTMWHRASRSDRIMGVLVAAGLLFSGLTASTVKWGHPEELLAGAMVAVVILAASRGRWTWAMVGAGLAIGTKQPCWLLAPTLPFILPQEKRGRWLAVCAAVAGVIIVPFVLPHIGAFVADQTGQVGANPATAGHTLSISLWTAFSLGHLNAMARPLILAIAVVLPVLAAWRNRWQLTVAQGAAVVATVLLLRAALDPFNITYYALPAFAALLALEAHGWRARTHPFTTIAVLNRLRGIPILALLAGELLAATSGGFISSWLENLNVTGHAVSLIYMLWIVIITGAMLVIAFGLEVTFTAKRARIYGALLVAAAAALCSVAVISASTPPSLTRAPAPQGFLAASPTALMRTAAPNPIYWFGPKPLGNRYLRTSAGVSDKSSKYSQIRSFFDYGASAISTADVAVITLKSVPPRLLREIAQCSRPNKNCVHASDIATPLGVGLLLQDRPASWELQIPVGHETVYLNSTGPVSVQAAAARLQIMTPGTAAMAATIVK